MHARWITITALTLATLSTGACRTGDWRVNRRNPETIEDLSYRFDEDDAREIARAMIPDALSKPWIDNWLRHHGGQSPIMVVGNVKNETEDYIAPDLFTAPFEEELINSGRVRVKARKEIRQELRDERLDTQFNDPETVKAIAKELNADVMLVGKLLENKERSVSGRTVIAYYMADLQLVDVETGEVLWKNTHEIEKKATR